MRESTPNRVKQVSKGYFHDYNELRHQGGKAWIAPNTLIREDVSSVFLALSLLGVDDLSADPPPDRNSSPSTSPILKAWHSVIRRRRIPPICSLARSRLSSLVASRVPRWVSPERRDGNGKADGCGFCYTGTYQQLCTTGIGGFAGRSSVPIRLRESSSASFAELSFLLSSLPSFYRSDLATINRSTYKRTP